MEYCYAAARAKDEPSYGSDAWRTKMRQRLVLLVLAVLAAAATAAVFTS